MRTWIFPFGALVVGIFILMVSRTLGTFEDEDEKWKDASSFRQMIYGPAGYYRAVGTIFGVVLIIVGLVYVIANLLPF